MGALTPDRLRGLGPAEVAALPLPVGNRKRRVDELFELTPGDPQTLTVSDASPRLDRVGAGMSDGRLRVEGSVGLYCARDMRGGELWVAGDCGDYAGATMRGGRLRVDGSVGLGLAAAPGGERLGMQGGVIVIKGNAGPLAGDRLRRGLVLIEGDAGAGCGARMIAGTLMVLGEVGADAGLNMRRGTLWLARPPRRLADTFQPNGEQRLNFLRLLLAGVRTQAPDSRFATLGAAPVRRWLGDRACGGVGEILLVENR